MSLLWYLAGVASGVVIYHQLTPWVMKKMGKDKGVLRQMVRGLNHDAFVNLRGAVEEEAERRDTPKN